jgi:hypothetical protein
MIVLRVVMTVMTVLRVVMTVRQVATVAMSEAVQMVSAVIIGIRQGVQAITVVMTAVPANG